MLEPEYRAGKFTVEPLSLSLKLKDVPTEAPTVAVVYELRWATDLMLLSYNTPTPGGRWGATTANAEFERQQSITSTLLWPLRDSSSAPSPVSHPLTLTPNLQWRRRRFDLLGGASADNTDPEPR